RQQNGTRRLRDAVEHEVRLEDRLEDALGARVRPRGPGAIVAATLSGVEEGPEDGDEEPAIVRIGTRTADGRRGQVRRAEGDAARDDQSFARTLFEVIAGRRRNTGLIFHARRIRRGAVRVARWILWRRPIRGGRGLGGGRCRGEEDR